MRSLIIGSGEIGKSLHNVLSAKHESHIRDLEDYPLEDVEVLNICYPPIKDFVEVTKKYIAKYKPKITIIHATVPVGTTRQCGENVVHSPVHGKHPNLAKGILTFTKYIGGVDIYATHMATKFLREAGITTKVVASPEASEISKIMCTSYYGWNIIFMKEMVEICKQNNVPFNEVYTEWNWHYNDGYNKLGNPEFTRPILFPTPGRIGGHCVVENSFLTENFITKTIRERNKKYKKT